MCLALGVQHPDYLHLDRRQMRDWQAAYDLDPWGEKRADWRQFVNERRWAGMLAGTDKELPSPVWPYFKDDVSLEDLVQGAEAFDAAIEPNPGGGWRLKAKDGDDNRQT